MFYFNPSFQLTLSFNQSSFNPYFTGCSTSTAGFLIGVILATGCFNPYFTGCSTSTIIFIINIGNINYSFNPYFTGCSTSTWEKFLRPETLFSKFQSLFYWMFYFNFKQRCFIEHHTRVSILILLDVLLQLTLERINNDGNYEVSILILLDVLLQLFEQEQSTFLSLEFQSLFYWMFYFNLREVLSQLREMISFNPYFTGCSTSTI